jgi:hypothetical protein
VALVKLSQVFAQLRQLVIPVAMAPVLTLLSFGSVTGSAVAGIWSDFTTVETPAHLTITTFGAGYGSPSYGTTHEGMELEQTLTRRLSLLVRLTSYQLYHGFSFDTPIPPQPGAPFFFGRFEGGIDLNPAYGFHLIVLGGKDAGDSHSAVVEESASAWLNVHHAHPINLSLTSSHYFENQLTNGLVDLRVIALSTDKLMLLLGAGAIAWGGQTVKGSAKVQAGPDFGVFIRDWKVRLDLQAGYGIDQEYGILTVSRSFDWQE